KGADPQQGKGHTNLSWGSHAPASPPISYKSARAYHTALLPVLIWCKMQSLWPFVNSSATGSWAITGQFAGTVLRFSYITADWLNGIEGSGEALGIAERFADFVCSPET